MRRHVMLVVITFALVGAFVIAGSSVSAQDVETPYERKTVTCVVDSAGYCTIQHKLGVEPVDIQITADIIADGWNWTVSRVRGSETASTFKVRAMYSKTASRQNLSIRFTYELWGAVGQEPPPPTTTTTTASPTTTTTPPVTTTTTVPPDPSPPIAGQVCGTPALEGGPTTAPAGATVVPAGDNYDMRFTFREPGRTFWFAPGSHSLGPDEFSQIIPGDGSTFVGHPDAVIDGGGVNRYAFTGDAQDVTVKYLEITGFPSSAQEGVVNHDGGANWLMQHLHIHDVGGAAVMFGSGNALRDSCVTRNGQYAWNSIGGSKNVMMIRNEISYNNTKGDEPGCGCSGGGKFWDTHGATVLDNWVHHNYGVGIWADQNNYNFLIAGNVIEDNRAHGIEYETSYNAVIRDNVLRRNTWNMGRGFESRGDNFPIGTIYLSEAGYDPRLPAPEGATSFVVKNNILEDNWGGIAGWENADRFCNSPANTSTGYCTIKSFSSGTPTWYETSDCTQPGIASEPLYSDCRWQTKNLDIHHNTFKVDTTKVDGGCPANYCATMSLFSNYGTAPDWSPYKGRKIQDAITYDQNNKWHDNTYVGDWRFVPWEPSNYKTWSEWRAAPYNQDVNSTLN